MGLKESFCTCSEAAEILGCDEDEVRRLVEERRLDGVETEAFGLVLRRWQVNRLAEGGVVSPLGVSAGDPDLEDYLWLSILGRGDCRFRPKYVAGRMEDDEKVSTLTDPPDRPDKRDLNSPAMRKLIRKLASGRIRFHIASVRPVLKIQLYESQWPSLFDSIDSPKRWIGFTFMALAIYIIAGGSLMTILYAIVAVGFCLFSGLDALLWTTVAIVAIRLLGRK